MDASKKVAILHSGDGSRFVPLVEAFRALGIHADLVAQGAPMPPAGAVLVWVNPLERNGLDRELRELAASGVFVSAHPDVILKIGTKEVLYTTRELGWGCDTQLYRSLDQMRRELPAKLTDGPRVLKQYRGNGGDGVWKVEAANGGVRVRHAKRGSVEEIVSLDEFLFRCAPYFEGEGRVIDQAWQPRLVEGMIRCYLVYDRVEGFGHQAINALHPTAAPGPRLYHPPSRPEFQRLKRLLEDEWVPAMQRLLGIGTYELPVLWDCDFLLGEREGDYVLCEINVSSVSPFPESALQPVARATIARLT